MCQNFGVKQVENYLAKIDEGFALIQSEPAIGIARDAIKKTIIHLRLKSILSFIDFREENRYYRHNLWKNGYQKPLF